MNLNKEAHVEQVVMAGTASGAGGKDVSVKNTKTLSGGERSYSTLAFTLALGANNESPFRAMDEFDVFMVRPLTPTAALPRARAELVGSRGR
jgi:hypothetical protein